MNGIGEKTGNTALENHNDIKSSSQRLNLNTNIDGLKILALSKKVSKLMNMPIQRNKAIVGGNAFSHSSGIHQGGFTHMKTMKVLTLQTLE